MRSHTTLASLGLALMEMRCPHCRNTQQLHTRSLCLAPRLTRCSHCKKLLVYQLTIKNKPDHILLALHYLPVFTNTQPPQSNDGEQPHASSADSHSENHQ